MSVQLALLPVAISSGSAPAAIGAAAVMGGAVLLGGVAVIAGAALIGSIVEDQRQSAKHSTKPPETSFAIATRMTNPDILQTALRNWGCKSVTTAENVHTAIEGARIVFEQTEGGPFKAVFVGNIPTDLAQKFIADVYGEYTRLVQQDVYLKLKQRAAARGFVLETEEIQPDDSIVLTLRVQE